jgi:purine nucleoside permease
MGAHENTPLTIKIVIVTMFDPPEGSGWPSELTRWVERVPLTERIVFPLGERDLFLNRERGVLAVVTGIGNARAAASITALGLDPRFDLSNACWLLAGIAGANPNAAKLGTAAWADWAIDGDIAHDIDAREMPTDWPTGRVPLGKATPFEPPPSTVTATMAYRLDPVLVDWAYRLTRDIALPNGAAIIKGAVLATSSLWHGWLLNRWAEEWVKYWSDGEARFVMSAMEDAGVAMALRNLGRAGRADARKLLILRTASNFVTPPPGVGAASSLAGEMRDGFTAYVPALEAAWRVGSAVMDSLLENGNPI